MPPMNPKRTPEEWQAMADRIAGDGRSNVQTILDEARRMAPEREKAARKAAAKQYAKETLLESAGAVLQGACWATGALLVFRLAKR